MFVIVVISGQPDSLLRACWMAVQRANWISFDESPCAVLIKVKARQMAGGDRVSETFMLANGLTFVSILQFQILIWLLVLLLFRFVSLRFFGGHF